MEVFKINRDNNKIEVHHCSISSDRVLFNGNSLNIQGKTIIEKMIKDGKKKAILNKKWSLEIR